MPIEWPASAKIREARLRIIAPHYGTESEMHRKGFYAPQLNEVWAGELVIAPASRLTARAYEAFVATLRGRLQPFGIPCAAAYLTPNVTASGTLSTAAACGSSTISAALTTGQTLPAGTLLMIGTSTAAAFQTVELLAAVTTTGSAQTLTVAPRIRHAFPAGAAVTTSSVIIRARLADDTGGDVSYNVQSGSAVLQVVEAVGAAGVLS